MLQKICNILSTILLIILAVIAAILIIPNIIGYKSMAVLSGSMEPEISVGSIVFVKEVSQTELKVGDVISYRLSGDTVVTHRIDSIDLDNKVYITKGDANEVVDNVPVAFENILGRLSFHIPYMGYITIYIKTPLGIAAGCGLLFIIILLVFLPEVFQKEESQDRLIEK